MSGSRTAMPPRQPSRDGASHNRELVFCHQCQNEWYREQHGLQCPRCQSEFTEILENDASDPREDMYDYDDDLSDEDEREEHDFDPHGHFHEHHHHHHTAPHGSGFTLRMGGTGPSISFRTIRTEFGTGNLGQSPFGGGGSGHVVGGLNANSRALGESPFAGSAFDYPPLPPGGPRMQSQSPPSDQPRQTPAATPNFGNGGGPIAEMFTSIIQNIIGSTRGENNPRNPGQFGDEGAAENNPGHPGRGFDPNGRQGSRSNAGSPLNDNPFFMQVPGARGGTTYYSSTRTWTGPNGEVRTIRTSSPMSHPRMQSEQATLDLADILANIISGQPGTQEQDNMPPFLRAFGLGHGASGDYAWSEQDMDRVLSQLMEQHQGNAPPPASNDSIRNLPKARVTQQEVDEGTECVVCQDEYKVNEEVVKLPCKHIYHEECVTRWLEAHDACPICRTPITPEEQQRQRSMSGGPGGGPPPAQPDGSGAGSRPGNTPTPGSGGGNGVRWPWSANYGQS